MIRFLLVCLLIFSYGCSTGSASSMLAEHDIQLTPQSRSIVAVPGGERFVQMRIHPDYTSISHQVSKTLNLEIVPYTQYKGTLLRPKLDLDSLTTLLQPGYIWATDTTQGIEVELTSNGQTSIQRIHYAKPNLARLHIVLYPTTGCSSERLQMIDSVSIRAQMKCGNSTHPTLIQLNTRIANVQSMSTSPHITLEVQPQLDTSELTVYIQSLEKTQTTNDSPQLPTDSLPDFDHTVNKGQSLWNAHLNTILRLYGSPNSLLSTALYYQSLHALGFSPSSWNTLDALLSPWVIEQWVNQLGTSQNHPNSKVAEAYLKGFIPKNKAEILYHTLQLKERRRSEILNQYGYLPFELEKQSVSKLAEIGFENSALSQMAQAMNIERDVDFFSSRSHLYRQLYDSVQHRFVGKSQSGRLRPRPVKSDYSSVHADVLWATKYDIRALRRIIGDSQLLELLDSYGSEDTLSIERPTPLELHLPYLYTLIDRPTQTQSQLAALFQSTRFEPSLCRKMYQPQMYIWTLFTSLGFFPLDPWSGQYLLGRPNVAKAEIALAFGKTLKITTENWSPQSKEVESYWWNDKQLTTLRLSHQQILAGGTLHFVMK